MSRQPTDLPAAHHGRRAAVSGRKHPGDPTDGARTPFRQAAGRALLLLATLACTRPLPPVHVPEPVPPPPPAPVILPAPLPDGGALDGPAGTLRFEVVGSGPDTVIVPLGTWLRDSLAALGDRHTLVLYDPRHRGRSHTLSDTTAATFDGDVDDLEAVRTSLRLSRVAVIGYDYYAAVAAAWAARHPANVTRLVLLSPIEPTDSLSSAWEPPARMARLDTVSARALVKARAAGRDTTDLGGYCEDFWRVNAPLFIADTALASRWRAPWCALPNESPARLARAAGLALSSLGEGTDLGARAAGVSVPVLVIHGREDLVANPDGALAWTRSFPEARLLRLRDTGHLPFIEAADQLRRAIDFFLGGNWPPLAERGP